MAKTTKFVARIDGVIVGKRTSTTDLTHAIVAKTNIAKYNATAQTWTARDRAQTQRDFDYELAIANRTHRHHRDFQGNVLEDRIANAHARTKDGYEAYDAAARREHEKRNTRTEAEHGKPFVVAWSRSERGARDRAHEHCGPDCWKLLVAIVPAEKA